MLIIGIVFGASLALFFIVVLAATRQPRSGGAPVTETSWQAVVLIRTLAAIALVSGLWLLTWWSLQPPYGPFFTRSG